MSNGDFNHGLGTPSAFYGSTEMSIFRALADLQKARPSNAGSVSGVLPPFGQTDTPPQTGGGNGGGQAFEVWLWAVDADKDAGTPWSVDAAAFGTGTLRGLDFNVAHFGGAKVEVDGLAIPQGTGAEAYAHWAWDSATQITIYHLSATTALGVITADIVSVTALR